MSGSSGLQINGTLNHVRGVFIAFIVFSLFFLAVGYYKYNIVQSLKHTHIHTQTTVALKVGKAVCSI